MVNNKVQGQSDFILMEDVELRVREGGRDSTRRKEQRTVHAFCIGEVLSFDEDEYSLPKGLIEVTYNPFIHDSFVIKRSGKPIFEARIAVLIDERLFVIR